MDKFSSHSKSIHGPGLGPVPIVQHDSNNNPTPLRSILFLADGDVSIVGENGNAQTITVEAGWQLDMQIVRINNAGTTLTNAQMLGSE